MRERGHPTALQRAIMSKVFRPLFALALLAFGSSAFAVLVPEYAWKASDPRSWYSTTQAACNAFVADQMTYLTGPFDNKLVLNGVVGTSPNFQCDVKSLSYNGNVVNPHDYYSLYMRMVEGGPPPNLCTPKAGTSTVANWTVGYARTPDKTSNSPLLHQRAPSVGQRVCLNGCQSEIDPAAVAPGLGAYVSQTPNDQGLYRVSVDYVAKVGPEQCSPSPSTDDARVLSLDSVDPPCPGYVGTVNNVKGCYGTADKPVAGSPSQVPPSAQLDAGNPAAGSIPTTGEGSGTGGVGRTPSTGAGGSAGGPASAAAGGKGTGAGTGTVAGQSGGTGRVGTQAGTEQANCGAPGQSPCKIDEEGTPNKGDFAEANDAMDTAKAGAKDGIDGAASMQAPTWSFSFQFPTGCTAYSVATFKGVAFTLNPCQYQGTIHDLLSMIWAAVTAFCIIGMVGRTIREA